MKIFLTVIFTALSCFAVQQFFPWWIIVPVAFLTGFFAKLKPLQTFAAGFTGIFLLWGIYALIIDMQTHSILTLKISQLFFLDHAALIIIITGIIGGVISGLGALSGMECRKLLTQLMQ